MTSKIERPYGLWESPLTPKMMAQSLRLTDVQWDTGTATLAWLEGRSGRNIIVAQQDLDAPRDLFTEYSALGGIGYGGGEFTLAGGNVIFAQKNRLYTQRLRYDSPRPVTLQFGTLASPAVSPDGR